MLLTALESAVLEAMLVGNHPILVALRAQLPFLSVKLRNATSAGCFTEFVVGEGAMPAPVKSERVVFGDVQAKIDGLQLGAGFVVYVINGFIHLLEGYTFEEPWPGGPRGFTLAYTDSSRRKVLATLNEHSPEDQATG